MEDFNKVTLNIPELMEDELLYSFIIRMAKENAMECKDFVRIYIDNLTSEKRKKMPTSPFWITSTVYVLNIASILEVDPLDFFLKTTIYPGVAPFMSAEKQGRVINIRIHFEHYFLLRQFSCIRRHHSLIRFRVSLSL